MRPFSRDRRRDRGVDSPSRGETETKAFRARDRDEAEAYQGKGGQREAEAIPSRGTAAPRDGLKTEASKPRPHP